MFSNPRKIECRQNTVSAFTDSVLAGIGVFWTLTTRAWCCRRRSMWGRAYATPKCVTRMESTSRYKATAWRSNGVVGFPKRVETVCIKAIKESVFREARLSCAKSTAWNASSSPWCSESG